MERANFCQRRGARQHHGENILLADAPRDELRVLRPEIEDYDCLGVHVTVWQGAGERVKNQRLGLAPHEDQPLALGVGNLPSCINLRCLRPHAQIASSAGANVIP